MAIFSVWNLFPWDVVMTGMTLITRCYLLVSIRVATTDDCLIGREPIALNWSYFGMRLLRFAALRLQDLPSEFPIAWPIITGEILSLPLHLSESATAEPS